MLLADTEATNFRNLTGKIVWGPRLNIIFGNNGQGKTSWLEAIHILARTKSFRTQRLQESIRFGERVATRSMMSVPDEDVGELTAGRGIEVRGRFVEHEQSRVHREHRCDGHPSALPEAEVVWGAGRYAQPTPSRARWTRSFTPRRRGRGSPDRTRRRHARWA